MSIIDYNLRPNSKLQIMMRVLIIFVFFVSILPFDKPDVIAQEPDKPHTVYLPVVSKNYEEWLDLFNQYRVAAGLNPVTSNADYNYGLRLHTTYMLLNPLSDMHVEDPNKPGYTLLGAEAGRQSNMISLLGATYLTTKQSIDLWMATPKHRYNMLHPDITESGFSLSCDSTNCFSGLNVLGSLPLSYQYSNKNVIYPAENQTGIPPTKYPITWSFYMAWTSKSQDSNEVQLIENLTQIIDSNKKSVPFDFFEPDNSNGSYDTYNQVVIIPKENLLPNHRYKVEMTTSINQEVLTRIWYFTTSP
jgi:hypothetical protein